VLTGSFILDVYGGQPEWGRNLEGTQPVGAELERALNEATEKLIAVVVDGLTPINEKRLRSVDLLSL